MPGSRLVRVRVAAGRFQPLSSTVVCAPAWPPSGKMLGHIGQLAQGDAIDKILAATVDGISDLNHVFPVLGDFTMEDRVGVEQIMVGVLEFIAFGVVKGQGRLEPTGDRVSQIRDQLSRLGHDNQLQPFAGLKPIAVHAAGEDLAVDNGWQRDVHLGGRNGFLLIVGSQLPEGCSVRDGFRLPLGEFRQLADPEAERVRQPGGGCEPYLAFARLGVSGQGDAQGNGFGDGRVLVSSRGEERRVSAGFPRSSARPPAVQTTLVADLRTGQTAPRRLAARDAGGPFLLQFPQLLSQVVELLLASGAGRTR